MAFHQMVSTQVVTGPARFRKSGVGPGKGGRRAGTIYATFAFDFLGGSRDIAFEPPGTFVGSDFSAHANSYLHATILHLLGLDHAKLAFPHRGRDERLTDVYAVKPIRPILAQSTAPPQTKRSSFDQLNRKWQMSPSCMM